MLVSKMQWSVLYGCLLKKISVFSLKPIIGLSSETSSLFNLCHIFNWAFENLSKRNEKPINFRCIIKQFRLACLMKRKRIKVVLFRTHNAMFLAIFLFSANNRSFCYHLQQVTNFLPRSGMFSITFFASLYLLLIFFL